MANQPYFPNQEGKQGPFFNDLQTKASKYYPDLEITTDRQAKLTLVLAWLIWAWQIYLPARRKDTPAATSWREDLAYGVSDETTNTAPPVPAILVPPTGTPFYGMLTWLFEEIGRWKKAQGYTDSIGADLGIIGPAPVAHTDPPQLWQGNVAQNSVEILTTFYEHAGASLESLRQGETVFSFLAIMTSSPYTDTRPVKTPGQAEWRDYRACWWDNDTASMQFGPVLRVLVNG